MRKFIAAALAAILATVMMAPALVLAAPGLVYVDKPHCGLLQDGTSAHPYCNIQDGVNAVASGGTVKVLAGTYNEDVNVNKPVLLMGPQQGDPRTRNVSSADAVVNGTTNDFLVNAANVTISGFVIQNGDTGVNIISGLSPTKVQRNIIQDNGIGVYLGGNGTQQQFVYLNAFRHNNKSAPAGGNGIYTDQVQNAFVDTNAFSDNANSAFTSTGFSGATANVRFSRNNSSGDASMVNWYNTDASVIDSNDATNVTYGFGIFLGGGNDSVQITRNQLHDSQWGGIGVRDLGVGPNSALFIDSNIVQREAYDGILLATGSVSGSGNKINRNSSDNGQGDGIHLQSGVTGVSLDSNHMHGNAVFDAEDNSAPANTWTRNGCTTDSPPNLCSFA